MSRRSHQAAAGLLLLAAVAGAYWPTLGNGFIWDDDAYVYANDTLRSAEGLRRIWFDVRATPQYYPAVHTSYWIEFRLWGLNPAGYHAVNVFLHALAALLLWRVLLRLGLPGAWLAAALFALHPVHVESVAWITERKNVLGGAFYCASALAYLHCREAPTGRRRRLYAASLLLFTGALLSKTVTGTLPAALLLVVWWKTGRVRPSDVRPLIPFFALAATFGALTAYLEVRHVGASGEDWSLSWLERIQVAGRVPWFYVSKLLWPARLTFIYPRWDLAAGSPAGLLYPLASAALIAALWLARGRLGRGPLVAALFFGGTLFPALGFFNVYPMRYSFVADHFQYLASIGPLALVAAAAARAAPWVRARAAGLVPVVAALTLLSLATLTWRQCHVYRDLPTLWLDTLAKNPAAWMAHNNLGKLYQLGGRLDDAIRHYRQALALRPEHLSALNNLGNALMAAGRMDEAVANLELAADLEPRSAPVHKNLGTARLLGGDPDGALEHFRRAIALSPGYVGAHQGLAMAYLLLDRTELAGEQLRIALGLAPTDPMGHVLLGELARLTGRPEDALAHQATALRLDPRNVLAQHNLGVTLLELGRADEARPYLARAAGLEPALRPPEGEAPTGHLSPTIPTPRPPRRR